MRLEANLFSLAILSVIFDLEKDGNFDIFLHRLDRFMHADKFCPAGK